MPALPVIANVYRIALNWRHTSGQLAVNVIHIHDESGTVTDSQLRTQLDAAAGANMWSSASLNATVQDLAITKLDGVTGTTHGVPATPSKWTGGNADPFQPQVAVVVKLTTGLRGRSHRGRVFVPFTVSAAVTDGNVNPTTAGNMGTAWSAFNTTLLAGANNLDLVVASYKLATAQSVLNPIGVELVGGTQRRRNGRLRGA